MKTKDLTLFDFFASFNQDMTNYVLSTKWAFPTSDVFKPEINSIALNGVGNIELVEPHPLLFLSNIPNGIDPKKAIEIIYGTVIKLERYVDTYIRDTYKDWAKIQVVSDSMFQSSIEKFPNTSSSSIMECVSPYGLNYSLMLSHDNCSGYSFDVLSKVFIIELEENKN